MSGTWNAAPAAVGGSGRLAGKSVLITGAGSGLGRESALLFAAEGGAPPVQGGGVSAVPEREERCRGHIAAFPHAP